MRRGPVRLSLCMTVKNEAAAVTDLARDLRGQQLAPDEIVITDGGSTDGTLDVLERQLRDLAPLELISVPGANIAAGRNRAIREASGRLIAVADAGLRLPPTWLRSLAEALEEDPSLDVAFGYVLSRPQNLFETVLGVVTLPVAGKIAPDRYMPSAGCVAFRGELFERYCYPEWLDYGEDLHLDLRWRADGLKLGHVEGADVGFRPRGSLAAFFAQYLHYAEGDGVAGMRPGRHAIRYGAYAAGALLLVLARRCPFALVPLLTAGAWYLRNPYRRLLPALGGLGAGDRLLALAMVPPIRATGDLAKMLGFIRGLLKARGVRPSR